MGQILKFPVRASKFGFRRVPKRGRNAEDPAQLHLFAHATAQVLQFDTGEALTYNKPDLVNPWLICS